jgi:hypothetical protein
MFDLSEYSPAQGHFLNQRDRVLQGCPEIAKKEVPATDLKRTESELTESGQATSKVPQTANGGIKTTASSESITAPTATSSSESTTAAPTKSNTSEKLGKGYLLGCWSFMLFLGINGF